MSKLLFLVAVVSLAVSLVAQSQPPTPSPTVTAQAQQAQSTPKNTQAQQASSPTQSLTTVSNPASPVPAKQITNYKRSQSDEKPPNDGSNFTNWFIAIFTFALVAVGVGQLILMRQQTKTTRVLSRARLSVKGIQFIDDNSFDHPSFRGEFSIYNLGSTNAHIFERQNSYWWINANSPLPDEPPYQGGAERVNLHIGPKDSIGAQLDAIAKNTTDFSKVDDGTLHFYAVGYIRYRDEFGGTHETRYAARHRPGMTSEIVTRERWTGAT